MINYKNEKFSGYNKPKRTPGASKKSAVLAKEGDTVRLVRFGDPNMSIKKHIPERRANFRARMNCDDPGSKLKARYWACRSWGLAMLGGMVILAECNPTTSLFQSSQLTLGDTFQAFVNGVESLKT